MRTHKLKCWPSFFQAIIDGVKTFEVRKDDRAYECGDRLHLREWDRLKKEYTGRAAFYRSTYLMAFGPEHVIMAIVPEPKKCDHEWGDAGDAQEQAEWCHKCNAGRAAEVGDVR